MNERRWFQIHLSTAVLATLAAALILGLNVQKSPAKVWHHPQGEWSAQTPNGDSLFWGSGWPWVCFVEFDVLIYEKANGPFNQQPFGPEWILRHVVYNALIALLIIGALVLISEGVIRRKWPLEWLGIQ